MAYFIKRYHPPGTAPGTLERPVREQQIPLTISLLDYSSDDLSEQTLACVQDSKPYLERDSHTWIHVQGHPDPDTLRQLGVLFGLHPLALEDVVNTGQRPKFESYREHLFAVLSLPRLDAEDGEARTEQVSLFASRRFLISFHQGAQDPFEPVRKRLREQVGKIRSRGMDHLLYALVDVVIDESFPPLEAFGDEVERLEDELLENPDRATLYRLQRLKRNLLLLRRMLWPQREAVNALIRDDSGLVSEESKIYFRDCYDHTIQVMDLLETYRDMTTSMLDIYLSSVSNRLNDIMRVLTMIATIFIPLTFVVGVYGMNFRNDASPWAMPELHWYYGYPLIWLIMVLIAIGMLVYFKRKGWF